MGRVSQIFFFFSATENAISRCIKDYSISYFEMLQDYRRGFLICPGDVLDNDSTIEGRKPSTSEYRKRPLACPGDVLDDSHTRKQTKHRHKTP